MIAVNLLHVHVFSRMKVSKCCLLIVSIASAIGMQVKRTIKYRVVQRPTREFIPLKFDSNTSVKVLSLSRRCGLVKGQLWLSW